MPLIRRDTVPSGQPEPRHPADVLRDGTADQRWNAARALGASPLSAGTLDAGALGASPLGGVSGDTSVEGLAAVDAVEALANALPSEADARVRQAIFTSLVRLGSPACVAAVIPCLRVDDPQLRGAALDALRAMIGVVRPMLPALLADPDADVRLLSCDLARELSTSDATRLLCDVLARDTEPNVCAAAVDVLAEIGDAEALPFLEACAGRFGDVTFLGFAVRIAMQRIVAERPAPHAGAV
jgi:HEAT repeat protein